MPRFYFTSIFAAGLLFTLFLFYMPWLLGTKAFYLTDITNHFEPTMRILSEFWCKGQFQLWNPYAHCGEPQIAIPQPNLFYPPNWTFAFLPFNKALALNLIGHQFVAGIGNYLLIISLGWGFAPACVAGVVAALSAYMFSLSTNYTLMASAAWLPLVVFSLRSLRVGKRFLHLPLSTVSIAMMILTGRPEIFAPALLLLGLYVLFSLQQNWTMQENALEIAGWQFGSIALGILLTAPFILPTIEWQSLSPRAQGLVSQEVLVWSANWYDFVTMLLPQPLGDLIVRPDKFLNLAAARPGYPPYLLAFVGTVVIALAIVGILDKSWRAGLIMSGVLVLFLVLAAGNNLPVAPYLVTHFPKLAVLRFPVKLLFFPVWLLSLFAARGLFLILNNRVSKVPVIVNLGLWSTLALIGLAFPFYQQVVIATAQSGSEAVFKAQQLIFQSLAGMSSVGFMISLLIWMRLSSRISNKTLSYIVVGTIYLQLTIHAFSFSYHGVTSRNAYGLPDDFFDKNPTYVQRKLTELHQDLSGLVGGKAGRIVTLYFSGLLMPNKLIDDSDWPASYYQYGRQILTPSTHFDQKFCSSFGYEGAETSDYRKLFVDCFNKSHVGAGAESRIADVDRSFYRFCQATSTNYVFGLIDRLVRGRFLETAKLHPQYFDLLLEDRTWNLRIYKVHQPLPRIYMSYRWQLVQPLEAVDIIANANTIDFDPWSKTLIDSSPEIPASGRESGQWQAEFLENSANNIRIKAVTPIAGLCVLTDHFYPGWLAFIDGQPATIYRANGVLRAVFLPAGEHVIEFKYEPESLRLGLIISAFSLLLLVAIVFAALRRRL